MSAVQSILFLTNVYLLSKALLARLSVISKQKKPFDFKKRMWFYKRRKRSHLIHRIFYKKINLNSLLRCHVYRIRGNQFGSRPK